MSIEEQDQILGRLVRETRETERGIAALETKIALFFKEARQALEVFDGTKQVGALKSTRSMDQAISAVLALRTPAEIAKSMRELEAERVRLTELRERLRSLTG